MASESAPKRIVSLGFGRNNAISRPQKKSNFVLLGMGDRALRNVEKYEVAIGMPAALCFYVDENLYKSGGAHNLKHYLENPVLTPDESLLPGWTNVRKLMERLKGRSRD